MAPLLDSTLDAEAGHDARHVTTIKPRFLIIGAGSRGTAYAAAILRSNLGTVAAIAEPVDFKRQQFLDKFIWSRNEAQPGQHFSDWNDFVCFELQRRKHATAGHVGVSTGVDGVFVCVKDDLHAQAVTALAPLGLHIMCEKPLATTLADCLSIQRTLSQYPPRIFAIGHVLRYSPHNMLLRHLLLQQRVIGDVLSMEHTEPVGWWHFSHSYVRGQWRRENISAPSLLTKSCHDIDFILWMLSSPPSDATEMPHLPTNVSSTGSLKQFRRVMKPKTAGSATNCLSCSLSETCMYSAKRIYYDSQLAKGNAKWPVEIVNPQVPHILETRGALAAKAALFATLAEDYDETVLSAPDIESRPWYGRCVWESDNDVCDDQIVTFTWDDALVTGKGAKTATFHMIAQTLAQCERRGRIYGTEGEISYDSKSITVHDFTNDHTEVYNPEVPANSHHGGGDDGLTEMFVRAVTAVDSGKMTVKQAQREFMGCTLEECVRSHAAVFAADEARRERKVVDWHEWWTTNVDQNLQTPGNGACR
ncbi:hypothetical protein BAUCODRAFT_37702 [Baudoinia panamericana UAMH 10762]|uniref:Gfo/Idh/MocA-like oxidoreductase N-terminal domain-containing protein n=1 Tax=Baudoinia panamericana (strain UAMH 10762) TaxID=717646 RepID=M2N279_BAUPA|nr:uncharacterized protein BAUCODRAFT_37702 [Baudoinia panamericana UAMH 10762]EMC92785.1 hypothetical protein BAUCODRAFT_37702 [Baudoinia panamericana UAMH 10762]